MRCLRAFIGLGLSVFGAASAELQVSHSTRTLSAGWTEHLYSVVQTAGPGEVQKIEFGPLFADGSAMTSRAGSSYPVLAAPKGWIPYQGYYEETDTAWFGFEALPKNPGLAAGEAAVFKVYTPDERFKREVEFKCYATAILSNYQGMTRPGKRLPSSHRSVFSQDFTSPNPGYDNTKAGRPEAWGFAGPHWMIHAVKAGHQGPLSGSSSIETAFYGLPAATPSATLDYSLQSPTFPKPIVYAPGTSGFIVQFGLEFQNGWSRQDAFSLCLEDTRKGEEAWCLRVQPQPRESGIRFTRKVSLKDASGQGAAATVKPGEDDPKEEELSQEEDPQATGWWTFQIEFTNAGDARVMVRPDPLDKFQSLLSFRYRKEFRFDRLGISYRTAKERQDHHNISLDDFLVLPTTP